jgi:uncharacterized protein
VIATLLYNLVLAYADAVFLLRVARKRTLSSGFLGAVDVATVAVFAAILVGDPFGMARLAAYGLFLHGAVFLGGSAWLLRRVRPVAAWCSAGVALVVVLTAVDGFLIEPEWLEVTHLELASPKLSRPVRVVVVADLQCDRLGDYEKRVLRTAIEAKPDLILLAGDYVQIRQWETALGVQDELNAFLREIGFSAPLGVFAVQGNVDSEAWPRSFANLPITAVDATRCLDLGPLRLTCLSLADSRRTDLQLSSPRPDQYHLVLGHVPDFALGRVEADLLVAGHTHGGQVQLPLVGALVINAHVPRAWGAGLTELPSGAHLLVSRGIGMERGQAPRLRLFCRPQLVVIDLKPAGPPQ